MNLARFLESRDRHGDEPSDEEERLVLISTLAQALGAFCAAVAMVGLLYVVSATTGEFLEPDHWARSWLGPRFTVSYICFATMIGLRMDYLARAPLEMFGFIQWSQPVGLVISFAAVQAGFVWYLGVLGAVDLVVFTIIAAMAASAGAWVWMSLEAFGAARFARARG